MNSLYAIPAVAEERKHTLDDSNKFASFLDPFIHEKMKEKKIPGAAFVMVKDGKVFYAKGYGYGDLEKKKPVRVDQTLFRVASISKLVTATAAMQLVEQGKVDLHANVNQYLKQIKLPQYDNQPITLHHLLTHTSGLDDSREMVNVSNSKEALPPGEITQSFIHPPVRPPGKMVSYSNTGIEIVGRIITDVTGVPFAQYVKKQIFTPLQMKNSTFIQDFPEHDKENLALGYRLIQGKNVPQPFSCIQGGAYGSMMATPLDLASFMIAHLQGGKVNGKRILQQQTVNRMHLQHFTPDPRMPGMAYGFFTEMKNGRRALFHEGKIAEATSILYLIPEENVGFFFIYNRNFMDEPGRPLTQEVKDVLMDRYFLDIENVLALAQPLLYQPKLDSSKFAGTYRATLYSAHSMEKIAALFFQVRLKENQRGALESKGVFKKFPVLVPVKSGLFKMLGKDQQIVFKENQQGKVEYFYVEGDTISYERIPWYETDLFHFSLLGWFIVIFLISTWGIAVYVWRWIAKKPGKFLVLLSGLIGLFNILFLVGIFVWLLRPMMSEFWGALSFGVPWELKLTSMIPLITGSLSIAVISKAIQLPHGTWSMKIFRSYYLTVAWSGLGFVLFTWYWNLVWLSY
ncbi:serine hydrolase domain-containing protein [Thermoflavimicrobium dichotomicum]|nr:serine hydrolase domain-containing protein [Thermoflavimicrobium dichotomicum]